MMNVFSRPFSGAAATTASSIIGRMIHIGCIAFVVAIAAGIQLPTIAFAALPARPAVYVNTTYVAPTGVTRAVSAGGDLQAALNAAQPGDVITLAAGATYLGPFTLPNKIGTGWITVRTSVADGAFPLPGTRVSPSHAPLMPRLVASSGSVITTAAGAHHYRFIGVNISPTPGAYLYNLVSLGSPDGSQAGLPHDIIFDRSYLHGDPVKGTRRGIALNSAASAVIDSYLSDFKDVGFDSQAVAGWNGPGPYKIVNNYLEAAGENVAFGGVDPSIPNLVPSDIEFRNNYCFKPLAWNSADPSYDGSTWLVKNFLELKNAQRVLIDGNTFENNWSAAQNGFGILFTVRNQSGGAPWSVVQDVTFTNNSIRNSEQGINILTVDLTWPSGSQRSQRILIQNNVWYGLGPFSSLFQILEGGDDFTINHNTGFPGAQFLIASTTTLTSARFTFTNNIVGVGRYGAIGTNTAPGQATLAAFFPGAVFNKNLLVGSLSGAGSYPSVTYNTTTTDGVGFVNYSGGDYRLTSDSAYHNAGTDGKDLGVNFDALNAAPGGSSSTSGLLPPSNLTIR